MSDRNRPRYVLLLTLAVPTVALVYPDGPPIEHTGGFGEPTCHACHFDGPLNGPDVRVAVGAPTAFEPDSTYLLSVMVSGAGLRAGGFMMSSRFSDGGQAGDLSNVDNSTAVVPSSAGIQYAMHTAESVISRSDFVSWTVQWKAPERSDTVRFHVAANAANGDDSEFGDLISTAEVDVPPIQP